MEKTDTSIISDWDNYDPIKNYSNTYKKDHYENSKKFLDELTKKSGIDIAKNKELSDKYETTSKKAEKQKKETKKNKGLYIFFIVFGFVGLVITIFFCYEMVVEEFLIWKNALITGAGVIGSLAFILIGFLVFRKRYKKSAKIFEDLDNKAKQFKKEAYQSIMPLLKLFRHGIKELIFQKTIPEVKLNKYFTENDFEPFDKAYDLKKLFKHPESSCQGVLSGSIFGNPFFFVNDLRHKMGTKVYKGTKFITWTETYTDSEGHSRTRIRTQTLIATIERPCPFFTKNNYLVYHNEAAPKLTFSRNYSYVDRLSEKELNKHVKKKTKEFKKHAKEMTKKGKSFTSLNNDKFEALWNCTNRNNEVEYRLMFTPLAQKKMEELLLDNKIGYGDDFKFLKYKTINIVWPEHLQFINLTENFFKKVFTYSYEEAKKNFIVENHKFFKAIYLSLAPIFAIPLYALTKPKSKERVKTGRNSHLENESILNCSNIKELIPENCDTEYIIKTKNISKDKDGNELAVKVLGYQAIPRVEYVPMMGRDGVLHNVPVDWIEYILVKKESAITIQQIEKYESEEEFSDIVRKLIGDEKDDFQKVNSSLVRIISQV